MEIRRSFDWISYNGKTAPLYWPLTLGIIGHSIGLVLPQYSVLSTNTVNWIPWIRLITITYPRVLHHSPGSVSFQRPSHRLEHTCLGLQPLAFLESPTQFGLTRPCAWFWIPFLSSMKTKSDPDANFVVALQVFMARTYRANMQRRQSWHHDDSQPNFSWRGLCAILNAILTITENLAIIIIMPIWLSLVSPQSWRQPAMWPVMIMLAPWWLSLLSDFDDDYSDK